MKAKSYPLLLYAQNGVKMKWWRGLFFTTFKILMEMLVLLQGCEMGFRGGTAGDPPAVSQNNCEKSPNMFNV